MKLTSIIICISLFTTSSFAKELVDRIVGQVGSEIILQSDLNEFKSRINKAGSIDDSLLLDNKLEDYNKNSKLKLDYLIREKMVDSEIKRLNLNVTEERVTQEIETIAKRGGVSKNELENSIKKQGFTIAEYREILKSRIERQSFFQNEIISKLRITDDDAYNEYKINNPNYKSSVNEFKIAQIFFEVKNNDYSGATQRAESVYKKLQSGENFEKLANTYTEDKSASNGGYLGEFKTGEFNKELEKMISQLEVGSYSPLIKTPQSILIFKLVDRKATQDPNFLKIKEQIKSQLVEKNFTRQLKNWFESKKQDIAIVIHEKI